MKVNTEYKQIGQIHYLTSHIEQSLTLLKLKDEIETGFHLHIKH